MFLRPKWASPAVLLSLLMVCWDWASDLLVGFLPGSSQPPTTTGTPSTTGSLGSQSDPQDSEGSTLPDNNPLGGGGEEVEMSDHPSTPTGSVATSGGEGQSGSGSSPPVSVSGAEQRSDPSGMDSVETINEQVLPGGEFCPPSAPHPHVDVVPEVQPPHYVVPSAPLPPSSAGQRLRDGLGHVPATSTRSLPGRVRSRVGPARSHPRLHLEHPVYRPVFGPSPAPSVGGLPQPRGTRTPSLTSVDLGSNSRLHAGATPGTTPYATPTGSQRSLAGPARQALHPPSALLGEHNYPSTHELDVLGQSSSLTSSWASGLNAAAESFSTAASLASDLEAGWRAANTVSRVSIKKYFAFPFW